MGFEITIVDFVLVPVEVVLKHFPASQQVGFKVASLRHETKLGS
jgi:hypothetical protein